MARIWEFCHITTKWFRTYNSRLHAMSVSCAAGNGWTAIRRKTDHPEFFIIDLKKRDFKTVRTVVQYRTVEKGPNAGFICAGCGKKVRKVIYLSPHDLYWYCQKCLGASNAGATKRSHAVRVEKLMTALMLGRLYKLEMRQIREDHRKFFEERPELVPDFLKGMREIDPKFYLEALEKLAVVAKNSLNYNQRFRAKMGPKQRAWLDEKLRNAVCGNLDIGVREREFRGPKEEPKPKEILEQRKEQMAELREQEVVNEQV